MAKRKPLPVETEKPQRWRSVEFYEFSAITTEENVRLLRDSQRRSVSTHFGLLDVGASLGGFQGVCELDTQHSGDLTDAYLSIAHSCLLRARYTLEAQDSETVTATSVGIPESGISVPEAIQKIQSMLNECKQVLAAKGIKTQK
jgi:hypothetical protein